MCKKIGKQPPLKLKSENVVAILLSCAGQIAIHCTFKCQRRPLAPYHQRSSPDNYTQLRPEARVPGPGKASIARYSAF